MSDNSDPSIHLDKIELFYPTYARRILSLVLVSIALSLFPNSAIANQNFLIDIARVTWENAPTSLARSEKIVDGIQTRVIKEWSKISELGEGSAMGSIALSVGTALPNEIVLNRSFPCDDAQFSSITSAIRSETYKRLGLTDIEKRILVILIPRTTCQWMGKARVGSSEGKNGVIVLHDTDSSFVISHEIGHVFGLGHSNLFLCKAGQSDGRWNQDCDDVEYGGAIDIMSNVDVKGPLSTYHLWRLGILSNAQVHQSWTNETVSLNRVDSKLGLKSLFLRDGLTGYWIEYRPLEQNGQVKSGIVIKRIDPRVASMDLSGNSLDSSIQASGLSSDFWLLNLDDFRYDPSGRFAGTPTLPLGKEFKSASGRFSLRVSEKTSAESVEISISWRSDITPPPKPNVYPTSFWISPDFEIIEKGYNDEESAVEYFQGKLNGEIISLTSQTTNSFEPIFWDPLVTRKNIRVSNLPEGNYRLQIRAIDKWGNVSDWSDEIKVSIDRGYPQIGTKLSLMANEREEFKIRLDDFKDIGSGLCNTKILNPVGFVTQQSVESQSPILNFDANRRTFLEVFDCSGNGLTVEATLKSKFIPAFKSKRTGKWSEFNMRGMAGLRCTGQCSASFTVSDNVTAVIGSGDATLSSKQKALYKYQNKDEEGLHFTNTIQFQNKPSLLRVSGRNLVLFGLFDTSIELRNPNKTQSIVHSLDSTVSEPNQVDLKDKGFQTFDFGNGWNVLPMTRGTTLIDPTLDLCSNSYKSDSGRQARRQVIVNGKDLPYQFLSTEVVKYFKVEDALFALDELKLNYLGCMKNGGFIENGIFIPYEFMDIEFSDKIKQIDRDSLVVLAKIGRGSGARNLLAVYTFKGQFFSGLYAVKSSQEEFEVSEVHAWLEVASVMVSRL